MSISGGISADPVRHAITEIAIAIFLAAVGSALCVSVVIAGYLVVKGFVG